MRVALALFVILCGILFAFGQAHTHARRFGLFYSARHHKRCRLRR